jgi:hypothetical protein
VLTSVNILPRILVQPYQVSLRIRWRLPGLENLGRYLDWAEHQGAAYDLRAGPRNGHVELMPVAGTVGDIAHCLYADLTEGWLYRDMASLPQLLFFGLDGYPLEAYHALPLAAPIFEIEPCPEEPGFPLTLQDWQAQAEHCGGARELRDLMPAERQQIRCEPRGLCFADGMAIA